MDANIVGRFFTISLTFVHNRLFFALFSCTFGMNGQNALLPINANILGINVKPAIKITMTAIENTGAKWLYGLKTVAKSVIIAKNTVPPLKKIGSET